jgi:cytochrome b561
MALRSTATAWGAVTRLFHWGMLLAYVGIIGVGVYMTDLALSPQKLKVYALHKSVGLTLLGLAALRLLWRLGERRPTPAPMPAWQQRAAGASHVLLYLLMFAVPLSGWLFNSAAGFPLQWFRLVNLPALVAPDPSLKALARSAHGLGVLLLVVIAALHAAAALKHHVIDRDRTLTAMLPLRGGPK